MMPTEVEHKATATRSGAATIPACDSMSEARIARTSERPKPPAPRTQRRAAKHVEVELQAGQEEQEGDAQQRHERDGVVHLEPAQDRGTHHDARKDLEDDRGDAEPREEPGDERDDERHDRDPEEVPEPAFHHPSMGRRSSSGDDLRVPQA